MSVDEERKKKRCKNAQSNFFHHYGSESEASPRRTRSIKEHGERKKNHLRDLNHNKKKTRRTKRRQYWSMKSQSVNKAATAIISVSSLGLERVY